MERNKAITIGILIGILLFFVFAVALLFQDTNVNTTTITNIIKNDVDNRNVEFSKDYNPLEKTLSVKDKSSLDLIDIKLLTPLHNQIVIDGHYVKDYPILELEVTSYQEVPSQRFLDKMEFYAIKRGMAPIDRDLKWEIRRTVGSKNVTDYGVVCNTVILKNGSKSDDCSQEIVGSHIEPIYEWNAKDVSKIETIPSGKTFVIRALTDVYSGDHVEWIPTFLGNESVQGIRAEEWADFEVYTRYEYQLSGAGGQNAIGDNQQWGNNFTIGAVGPNATFTLKGISLLIYGQGSPTSFNVSVYNVTTGSKGLDTLLSRNASISVVGLTTSVSGTWFNISMPDTTLEAGKQYKLFLHTNDVSGKYVRWLYGSLASYPANRQYYLGGSLASEELNNGAFQIFGEPYNPDQAPIVELDSPANDTTFTSSYTQYFAGTFKDDSKIDNSTLYIWYQNGSLYNTYFTTHSTNETTRNQSVTFNVADNNKLYKWNYLVFDNSTTNPGSWNNTNRTFNLSVISTALTLNSELNVPADNTLTSNTSLSFLATGTVSYGNFSAALLQVWKYNDGDYEDYAFQLNYSINNQNGTKQVGFTNSSRIFTSGNYSWNVLICGVNVTADIDCAWASNNYTFKIDTLKPTIQFTQIPDQFVGTASVNVSLNFTATDNGVAGLDSCWFTNETGLNESAVCGVAQTLTYTSTGNKNIIMYANDTLNNVNFTTQYFDIGNYLQDVNLDIIREGETSVFNLTLSKTGIGSLSVNAYLIYDDVVYSSLDTITSSTNRYYLEKEIDIPSGSGNLTGQIVEWYWNFSVSTLGNYTTEIENQTVLSVEIDDCSVYSDRIYEYRIVDEDNQTFLDPSSGNVTTDIEYNLEIWNSQDTVLVSNYSNNFVDLNPIFICINNVTGSNQLATSILKYQASAHALEYYNIVDAAINDTVTPYNITLYDLNESRATEFRITVYDNNFLPLEDALVYVDRQYIADGNAFKTVELPKTDSNGQTIANLVINTVLYNIRAVKDGVVVGEFQNVRAFCEDFSIGNCQIQLTASGSAITNYNYDEAIGISFSKVPTYDEASNTVSFSFSSASGSPATVTMEISRNDVFGNRTVCSETLSSASGTITCELPEGLNETETLLSSVIYVDGEQAVISTLTLDNFTYGDVGYIVWFVITLIMILAFGENKNGVLISLSLSYIGAILFGLARGDLIGVGSAGIWMLLITILGIWQLNRENQQ